MQFVEATQTDLAAIRKIVELSHETSADSTQIVESRKDWEFLKVLWDYWKINQPSHYQSFMDEVRNDRAYYDRENKFAEMKDERGKTGKMEMRHIGTMPDTFLKLIKNYFPKQDINIDFFRKLGDEIPEFRLVDRKRL